MFRSSHTLPRSNIGKGPLVITASSNVVAFLLYCFVQGITPGPANTVSFASGVAFGPRCCLRQWLGLVAGFLAVSVASFLLLWMLGNRASEMLPLISWAGAGYILYLAVHMLRATPQVAEASTQRPTFRRGFLVQATNAKIAIACIAAYSSYVLPHTQQPALLMLAVVAMPLVGTLCNLVWLVCGGLLTGFYAKHAKPMNILMAAALALCALTILPL